MLGLTEAVVRDISRQKKEPSWMLALRLKGLKEFMTKPMPGWGVDLKDLDFNEITYFNAPEKKSQRDWKAVGKKERHVFERLGIPEAERQVLAGVGAQWDSGVVYQNLKRAAEKQGVIFLDMDEAVRKQPALVRKYFMKIVEAGTSKFSALHTAVWSGGSFVWLPKGVKLSRPLQGYFWLNLKKGGQFEHTLIVAEPGSRLEFIEGCSAPTYLAGSLHSGVVEIMVGKGAKVRYVTVQNWSKDVYNLSFKRALVEEKGRIEWVSGSLGSKATMVYPSSVLRGRGAQAEHLLVSLASAGQELESGAKVIHQAQDTSSRVISKSISKDGGKVSYRGLAKILKGAKGSKSSVECQALILDKKSGAKTYPHMEIDEPEVVALHEARTGKIAEEELIYLRTRGLTEEQAMGMVINGFIEPVVKELPVEYAVEMNRLVELELEGGVG
jgi:Fe-S cluster assembly protein SufB